DPQGPHGHQRRGRRRRGGRGGSRQGQGRRRAGRRAPAQACRRATVPQLLPPRAWLRSRVPGRRRRPPDLRLMLRRALDVAVFAPLGAVATLTAAIARRVGRVPLPADDEVEVAPASPAAPTDPPAPAPTAWRGTDDDLPIEG